MCDPGLVANLANFVYIDFTALIRDKRNLIFVYFMNSAKKILHWAILGPLHG